jgi:lipopolysaccharide transport system ATP-binding protein
MNDIAIKIKNLSKQYRLGSVGTGTISHDLNRWWTTKILQKEDPYLRIGETNTRNSRGISDYVWALQDINLTIEKGDVVGIIGKNGAGKSTLLKILSRVTKPSSGTIQYNGRIASLLEVGTGFHSEMTGRENIYMNGSIMGMTKSEIIRKLDEIIDFAGVERYIDTPVKRYSSGMTVRLGFSIAAHLEPDILVVDEVLAVGDAEFQKKAIGKMQDVSRGGERTVLFVSHNMLAVKKLCKSGVLLHNGSIIYQGGIEEAINFYQNKNINIIRNKVLFSDSIEFNNDSVQLIDLQIKPLNGKIIDIESGFKICLKFFNKRPNINLAVSFNIFTKDDVLLVEAPCYISTNSDSEILIYEVEQVFSGFLLNNDIYNVGLLFGENQKNVLLNINNVITFEIEDTLYNRGINYNKFPGILRPRFTTIINKSHEEVL